MPVTADSASATDALVVSRNSDSRLSLVDLHGKRWLLKVYLNDFKKERCALEQTKLRHWRHAGFAVPLLFDECMEGETEPHLLIEFIEGQNLREVLRNRELPVRNKMDILRAIFVENAARHRMAKAANDRLLVHTDPNTDNILVGIGTHTYIDFEHDSQHGDITEMIGNEIAVFVRRAANDLGKVHLRELCALAFDAYREQPTLLAAAEGMTLGRHWHWAHALKDRLKRLWAPDKVTKYEVAYHFKALREHSASSMYDA